MTRQVTRREFVIGGAAGTAGLLIGGLFPACGVPQPAPVTGEPVKVTVGPPVGELDYFAATETSFPLLEVAGSPWEIGRGIGQRFGDLVKLGFERR